MLKYLKFLPLILLFGCAGQQASCSRSVATSFGADWIIVQYKQNGEPFNCWKLSNVAVQDELHSDGVWWQENDGHLVHISGWYNRVQVERNDYAKAATLVGVDLRQCKGGHYEVPLD